KNRKESLGEASCFEFLNGPSLHLFFVQSLRLILSNIFTNPRRLDLISVLVTSHPMLCWQILQPSVIQVLRRWPLLRKKFHKNYRALLPDHQSQRIVNARWLARAVPILKLKLRLSVARIACCLNRRWQKYHHSFVSKEQKVPQIFRALASPTSCINFCKVQKKNRAHFLAVVKAPVRNPFAMLTSPVSLRIT